jgi:TorA maturation chaperone TorD
MHLAELAGLRQGIYGLFSLVLRYPSAEWLERVAVAAASLRRNDWLMPWFAFFPYWQRLLDALSSLALSDGPKLEEEYVRLFMHDSQGTPCPPYESLYLDPEGKAAGWIAALVEGEYAAAGLALSPSLKDLPDHATVEMEFMSFLCSQEAEAWARESQEESLQTLERQATFLDRHLARWLPEWAGQIVSSESQGVYPLVAETARAFLSHDQDLIGTLLERLRRATNRPPPRPAGSRRERAVLRRA